VAIKCDWARFVDAEDAAPAVGSPKKREPTLYEIKFESSSQNTQPKYTHVRKNFLKAFKVRSLSMRKLNLITVDEHAFAKENFKTHCESLDLSYNSLYRLDPHVLENMDQLRKLSLSNNDLKLSENNFVYNPLLSKLDLSYNKIQFLTPNLFHNLEDLELIDLRGFLFSFLYVYFAKNSKNYMFIINR
jgi:Leucine-rich repeat (LRR) protein